VLQVADIKIIKRLHHTKKWSKRRIARDLGMRSYNQKLWIGVTGVTGVAG
jgi:hypothetical protein